MTPYDVNLETVVMSTIVWLQNVPFSKSSAENRIFMDIIVSSIGSEFKLSIDSKMELRHRLSKYLGGVS